MTLEAVADVYKGCVLPCLVVVAEVAGEAELVGWRPCERHDDRIMVGHHCHGLIAPAC